MKKSIQKNKIGFSLAVCLIIAVFVFYYIGVMSEKEVLRVGDYSITDKIYNFYYGETIAYFVEKTAYFDDADYALDFSKDLASQRCYLNSSQNWAEYFREKTINNIAKVYNGYYLAQQSGIIKDENNIFIISQIEKINNMTTKEKDKRYGKSFTIDTAIEEMEKVLLARTYEDESRKTPINNELEKIYTNNSFMLDVVNYHFVYLKMDKENIEENIKNLTKTISEAKNEKDFFDATKLYLSEEWEERVEKRTEVTATQMRFDEIEHYEISKWLFDENRQFPESAFIETIDGYYVAIYGINREKNTEKTAKLLQAHLLPPVENFKVNKDGDALKEVEGKKNIILLEYERNRTKENFINLIQRYSNDSDAAYRGGVERSIWRGEFTPEVEEWALDPERKSGDIISFFTGYGELIFYYISLGEDYWLEKSKDIFMQKQSLDISLSIEILSTKYMRVNLYDIK